MATLERLRDGFAERIFEEDLLERFGVPTDLAPTISALGAASERDVTALRDADLQSTVVQLEAARRLIDAASLRALAELDRRGTSDVDRGLHTGAWLAEATGVPAGVARSRVRLARDLTCGLPEALDALGVTRLGEHHARVLLTAAANQRTHDLFMPMVPDLIDDADTMPFDLWKAKVTTIVALLDADGPEPEDPTEDNQISLTRGHGGRWRLRGDFDAATGGAIREALERRADALFRARHADEQVAGPDLITPSRRRLLAQALFDMARADHAERHPRAATAPEMVLHLDAADTDQLTDDAGIRIGDTQRRTLLCDPMLRGVVFGLHRRVLDVGDLQRLVTAAQRRALDRRDGGCVFPGCDAPARWTDAHHVEHWADSGPTDLANLASLCRHHHGVSHRKGWTMGATDDEWFYWHAPTGRAFWSQRHGIQRRGAPPPPLSS